MSPDPDVQETEQVEPVRSTPVQAAVSQSFASIDAAAHAAPVATNSAPYTEADFSESVSGDIHLVPETRRVEILVKIIGIEGPVHVDELSRRFATVCGKDRAGGRIQDAVESALRRAVALGRIVASGDFYTVKAETSASPRDRSAVRSITLKRPNMLPPIEIRSGLTAVVSEHIGVEPEDAITEVARMFGFARTGTELHRAIEAELRTLLGAGALVLKNGNRLYEPQ